MCYNTENTNKIALTIILVFLIRENNYKSERINDQSRKELNTMSKLYYDERGYYVTTEQLKKEFSELSEDE